MGRGEATPLALIEQIDPIYANFTQPGSELLRLQAAIRAGKLKRADTAKVELVLEDGRIYGSPGRILFSDLANFTSFSEGKSPKQLLGDLNAYFAAMARVIAEERGILDKFIGDAIMAYWGAPVSNPRHAEHACRAALAQAALFREKFLPAYPGLGLRIPIQPVDGGGDFRQA